MIMLINQYYLWQNIGDRTRGTINHFRNLSLLNSRLQTNQFIVGWDIYFDQQDFVLAGMCSLDYLY